MIDALFNQPTYQAARKMLDATVMRHEAIASNLANIETPNYRRVDIAPTFNAELSRALGSGDGSQIANIQPKLQVDATAIARNRDGNSVQLESELMQLNQNSTEHALETQLISGALLRMRMAITGRAA